MLYAPSINPVLASIGPLSIHWYGLCYLLGFLGAYVLCSWRITKLQLRFSKADLLDIFSCAAGGILWGGRFWYLLFYQPWVNGIFFLKESFQFWAPGRSFHGGLIGVVLAVACYAWVKKRSFLEILDLLAFGTPVGIVFGRLGNFLNAELWGRVCDPHLPWAMIFPQAGPWPRHPSQLYEMFLEGFVVGVALLGWGLKKKSAQQPGQLTGIFLTTYALMRSVAEQFREPDIQLGFVWDHWSMGQLQSIPLLILGLYLIFFRSNRQQTHENLP